MTQGASILVVHGDPKTRQTMGSAASSVRSGEFRAAGVTSVATLAEALKAMDAAPPKLVFVGVELADPAGMGALRAIRAKSPSSLIIALVADEDHAAGAAALGGGAQDYLYATESRLDLVERSIIRAMERRRVEDEHEASGWRSGIGETILGLRHEINNPLAALMLNLEMLKEGGHEDADELIQGIELAAHRIAAVVRRLEELRAPHRIPALGGEAMVDLSGSGSSPNRIGDDVSPGREPVQAARACTILLVDDEESVRAIVTKILSRHGHKVIEAEHGAGALRLAEDYPERIDLLLTDMYMPGLRGPEILEKLRPARPDIRVLFMSGYGDEDVARSGVEPGSRFLRKPFTVQELSDAVQAALAEPA